MVRVPVEVSHMMVASDAGSGIGWRLRDVLLERRW